MISEPLVIQTSFPVEISVATATKGRPRSSILDAFQVFPHAVVEPHAAEEAAAADREIEQSGDPAHGQAAREILQFIQLSRKVAAADERADRGPGDHSDLHACFVEGAQHPDMRPAAGRPSAERKRDPRLRLRLFGGHRTKNRFTAVYLHRGCSCRARHVRAGSSSALPPILSDRIHE